MLRHAASRVGIRIGNLYALYRPAAIGRMVERSILFRYIFQGNCGYGGSRGRRPEASPQRSLHRERKRCQYPTGIRGLQGHTRSDETPALHRVRQCLATGGLTKRYRPPAQGLAPKVHGRRCGAPGRDRRPPRHALGTRHQHLLQRALLVFGDTRTARLASISVAHLYHLRGAAGYRARRQQGTKTRPTGIDRGAPWEIVATWRAALRGPTCCR